MTEILQGLLRRISLTFSTIEAAMDKGVRVKSCESIVGSLILEYNANTYIVSTKAILCQCQLDVVTGKLLYRLLCAFSVFKVGLLQ